MQIIVSGIFFGKLCDDSTQIHSQMLKIAKEMCFFLVGTAFMVIKIKNRASQQVTLFNIEWIFPPASQFL